jgi:protein O-GlcNAc transferase
MEHSGSTSCPDVALAASLAAQGDLAGARRLCTPIGSTDRAGPETLHLLASISAAEGDLETAEESLLQALAQEPRPSWHRDLGVIYAAGEQWHAASQAFADSGLMDTTDCSTLSLYGRSLFETGQFAAAEDAASQALALESDCVSALELLASVRVKLSRNDLEIVTRQRILQLRPDDASAHAQMGAAYCQAGEFEKGITHLRQAVALDPSCRRTHSALLNALLYDPDLPKETLLDEHVSWARRHCEPHAVSKFPNLPSPGRKLRVGYISGESTSSPSFHFLISIFNNHDPHRFETFYYRAEPSDDETSAAYRQSFSEWRDVFHLPESEVAELIRRDCIDILVDTGGHYGSQVLTVLAHRPAPVQVAFPNYPCTTGVAQIDYIFTDSWTCPRELGTQYVEQPYHLPSGYLVFQRPEGAAPVTPLPALQNGTVTFGLFQRPAKVNGRVWDAIAQVLLRVPDSRLLVHFSSGDLDIERSRTRERVRSALESRGVSPRRVHFRGALASDEHIAFMAEADIALDTFPYNGQTTTCECLWMGVPVVALQGISHVARVGSALLNRVGMQDWVARSPEEYVEIAVRKALDIEGLITLRAKLRDQMAVSSLLDGPGITREIEDAYRWMWQRWCSNFAKEELCQPAVIS